MNLKGNKTFITFVVVLVAFGLVMAYVPLVFTPHSAPPAPEENAQIPPPASALIQPPLTKQTATTSTPTSSAKNPSLPDSFKGLEEESKSLDGIFEDLTP